ncbi:MAG: glycosyltransferase [Fimbriimonadales bacterium]|nr:glycosyltransferase [Fimbriimonadales bacterium]
MSQPTISVVINNYNYGRFVAQAVESALAQRYPHKEILVVDDGSTDNSREVLEPYAAHGVRLIFKANGGQASAFNRGFQEAQGEVIAFLDADDYWHPELLETLASVWHSRASMALWRLQGVDSEGKPMDYVVPNPAISLWQGDIRARFAQSGWYPRPPTSGLAFARNTLNQILPIDEQVWRISADGPLFTLAPFLGEVTAIDRILGYYRIHGTNLWHSHVRHPVGVLRDAHHARLMGMMIQEQAHKAGLATHPRLGLHAPDLVARRLFFALLDAPNPLWKDDARALVRAGIAAVLDKRQPMNVRARLRYLRMFLAAALLPRPAALRVIAKRFLAARDDEVESLIQQGREALAAFAPTEVKK